MDNSLLQLLFAGVMCATYALIAFERLHKTVAALAGALLLAALALGLGVVEHYEEIHEILGHDLGLLGVIVGTSILVDLAGKSGLFHFLAIKIVKKTGGHPMRLFLALQLLVFAFAALLTVVPAMLIVSGLSLVICGSLGLPVLPYMLGVAFASNAGALCTFASGLTTLMIGTAARIPYAQFLVVSLPFALVSLVASYLWTRRVFRSRLLLPEGEAEQAALAAKVASFDEWALAPDIGRFYRSAIILVLTIAGFALAGTLGLGLDWVALAGGTAMLLFQGKKVEGTIAKVNWTVVLFFTGLFVIVGLVKKVGAIETVAQTLTAGIGDRTWLGITIFTWFSGVASAIVDNIPVAATMIPMVGEIDTIAREPLWWSLVLATNLGGNATPIGSISCVIAMHALDKEAGIRVSWGTFLKIGGALMAIQLALATLYLIAYDASGLLPSLAGQPAGH